MDRKTIFISLLLLVAAVSFTYFTQKKSTEEPIEVLQVTEPKKLPSVSEKEKMSIVEENRSGSKMNFEEAKQAYFRARKLDPKYEWKRPIKFYGKVVTLDDQPLEGVTVQFGWTALTGYETRTIQSDKDGCFELFNVQGKTMNVKLEKDGYAWFGQKSQRSFEFAEPYDPNFHKAERSNPVVYYMEKRPKAEPLHVWTRRRGAAYKDGGDIFYNYQTGKFSHKNINGNIRFTAELEPYDRESTEPFSWFITLSGNGLNFALSETYVVNSAPKDGYSGELRIGRSSDSENWNGGLDETVFFKTDNDQYGYLQLIVGGRPKEGKVKINLKSYFNPSGSRVLVYSSQKRIR